jgi:PKD domain
MTKLLRAFASLTIWVIPLVFVACGGENPSVTNKAPVAAFSSASPNVKAGVALLFTSSSSDPDGDVLTQSWDFGDDTRGGGSSIAHVFPSAGAFTVKLTVGDGKGGENSTAQSIAVTAGEPLGAPLEVKGEITDTTGLPLAGVVVKLGSSTLGTTDANGKVMVSIPTGPSQTLMLSKDGYTDQVAALEFPIGSTAGNGFFKVSMLPQAPAQPMNATSGGAIMGKDNAKLEIPANGLETGNGTPVTGNVEVNITPLDVSDPAVMAAMPGRLEGTQTDGSGVGIVSLGMTDFSLTQNGQDLNLKPGSSAKVRIPLYSDTDEKGNLLVLGDTIPLWSMSETTGEWVQEGIGTVVDTGNGIKALEAMVTHFSLWNADHIIDSSPPTRVKPKCKVPPQYTDPFKILVYCKFLAEMVEIFGEDGPNPNSANRLRQQAVTARQPAWRRSGDLPIVGNEIVPVVPNRNIRYISCVVLGNEELCGSEVRNLQKGSTLDLDILMLPVQKEAVTVPLDVTRDFSSSRRQFTFTVPINNELAFRVERTNGSILNAQVELRFGNTRIFSSELNQTPISVQKSIPSGNYTLEITPSSGSTGDVRIQIENSIKLEAVNLPFDTVRSLNKPQRFEFTAFNTDILTINLDRAAGSSLNATVKLFDNYTPLTTGAVNATPFTLEKPVLITGKHILEIAPTGGSSGDLRVRISTRANTNATWKPFYQVADTDVVSDQKPCFASIGNATGRTLMAWTERKTNNYTLRVSQYDPTADSFDTATTLATNNSNFTGNSYRCQIAVSSNNDAMVIWWLRAGTFTKDLFWSRRAAGSNAWSAPATLTTASTNYLFNRASELQIDANGNASVVWLEQHAQGTSSQLRTARYSPTSDTWTTSVLVAPVPSTKLSIPSLSSDSAGNQMVLYKTANQGAGSAYPSDGIYVQKFDLASTTWLAPTLIKTMTVPFENDVTSDQINPIKLKIGTGGHVIAVWSESSTIHSVRMNPSTGVWTVMPSISVIGVPAVEISATGVATTVFYSNPSSLAGQGRYQIRTLGVADAAWSTPTTLLQNDGGGNYVLLAMNPSGDAATVFQSFSPVSGFQFASRSSSSNSWTVANKISETGSGSTVSIDSNGQALLIRTVKQTQPPLNILEYQRISVR